LKLSSLESQKNAKKGIFGGGHLVSDRAAAEIKAAEIKAAEIKVAQEKTEWQLSESEREIIASLGED